MIAYIKTQGSLIHRKGQTLQVRKEDFTQTLFIHRLEQLVLMGNVQLTAPAINLLCREKVDTVFLTLNGRYKGRLEVGEGKNVFLHQRQFDSLHDAEFGILFARSVVIGKLGNMATLVGRIKRRNKHLSAQSFDKASQSIRQLIEQARTALNIESLRGYEGKGTALFFEQMRHGFKEDWNFRKRIRRPPTDPVNSVLSFLYTLLFNRVYAAIRVAGLNPSVGYLHSLDYGRYSLALDLIEEFRSIIAETCTLSVFNLKILNSDSFYFEAPPELEPEEQTQISVRDDDLGVLFENADDGFFDMPEQRIEENQLHDRDPNEKRPCRMHSDAIKSLLEAFEDKLSTEFVYAPTGRRITYSEALIEQARQFRNVLEGKQKHYLPLQMK